MTQINVAELDATIRSLPLTYRGPGGVAAVIKDGQVIVSHVWGFADVEQRIAMSADTLMPICSISKEFTCAVLLSEVEDLSALEAELMEYLPNLKGTRPTIAQLCNNQSGLRDYWALSTVCGADPEGVFTSEHARHLLGLIRTTHFEPGSYYSYSNSNFRLLSFLLEKRTGRSLANLLRETVFVPAQMRTAGLFSNTAEMPGDGVGYEGNIQVGFFPATNRIDWSGDAGICATLDDMIAWEKYIDASRDDVTGIYASISAPQSFSDGNPASYGFGLVHGNISGIKFTGHGGALRGWRCQRIYAADERLSVVVMFNHESNAYAAAEMLMRSALGKTKSQRPVHDADPQWIGNYYDPQTGLSLTLSPALASGPEFERSSVQILARFATSPEIMVQQADGTLHSPSMQLRWEGDDIYLTRPAENLTAKLQRITGSAILDLKGRYYCDELQADFVVEERGDVFYAAFEGFLGKGSMQPLYPAGKDMWLLPCQRGLDAPAPGDWTVKVERNALGQIDGLSVGCWLARGLSYKKR